MKEQKLRTQSEQGFSRVMQKERRCPSLILQESVLMKMTLQVFSRSSKRCVIGRFVDSRSDKKMGSVASA